MMQKILVALFAVVLTGAVALADWSGDFIIDYKDKGTEVAVTNALISGVPPSAIIILALSVKELEVEELFRALCNAGIPLKSMLADIEKHQLPLDTAVTACGPQEDVSPAGRFPGIKDDPTLPDYAGNRDSEFVSPHNFK